MLLVDRVYEETGTGKKILCGTLNTFYADKFPSLYAPATLFISLTDFTGCEKFELRLIDLSDFEVVFTVQIEAEASADRFKTHEITASFPVFPLPHAGTFTLEVHWRDILIGSLRLFVIQRPATPTEGEDDGNHAD